LFFGAAPDPREDRPVDTKAVDTKAVDSRAAKDKAARFAERPWHMLIGGDLVTGRTGTTYVWVNHSSEHIPGAAFGGMKNSGLGREESLEEIESYTQHKNVYIRY
jgi:hypothetical protein